MSKKNRSKGVNTPVKTPILPKPPLAATPDEKEGQDKKAQLIQEGEESKAQLIAQGEEIKRAKIEESVEEARKAASVEREAIVTKYSREAKEAAEQQAVKIRKEADEILKKAQEHSKTLEEAEVSLEEQRERYFADLNKLESDRRAYKDEVFAKCKTELEKLRLENQDLVDENVKFRSRIKQLERESQLSASDRGSLERELDDCNKASAEVIRLKTQISIVNNNNSALEECRVELEKKLSAANNTILRFGDNPQGAVDENQTLKKKIDSLENRLANCPETCELEKLREISRQFSKLQEESEKLKTEKREIERQLFDAKTYQADLDNKDKFIRVLELQHGELRTELDRITDRYNKNKVKVFAALSKIDEERPSPVYGSSKITLKALCDNFRNHLVSKKKLFYTEAHIRTFIAGFAASRLIILEGMSGTGKSSLPREFGEYIGGVTTRIPVQSSWKDRNDLLGFYNDFEKRYKETDFLKAIYRAVRDKDTIHCILLDEMNLSRIEYYFADLLSVLEEPDPQKRKLALIADSASIKGEMPESIQEGELSLTENIWFAGTANKDDSTFTITDKVYDRSVVLDFKERAQKPKIPSQTEKCKLGLSEFHKLLKEAKCSVEEKEKIDSEINRLDELMQLHFEISFGNRISSQIDQFVPAYTACGGSYIEAIDILFSTKVLRKIQGYDKSTEKGLIDIAGELGDEFKLSKDVIKKMQSRI